MSIAPIYPGTDIAAAVAAEERVGIYLTADAEADLLRWPPPASPRPALVQHAGWVGSNKTNPAGHGAGFEEVLNRRTP